jgi:hypothetical protein
MVSYPNCLQNKYTALMFAAAGGNFDVIRILLDASTNVRFSSGTDSDTMLLTALVLFILQRPGGTVDKVTTNLQRPHPSPVSEGPKKIASRKEVNEVMRLAAAALEDPRCNAATLRVAVAVCDAFNEGEPFSLDRYRATVIEYTPQANALKSQMSAEEFLRLRAQYVVLLRMAVVLDYPGTAAGKGGAGDYYLAWCDN